MNWQHYQEAAMRTVNPEQETGLHAVMGIVTEAGELMDIIKRLLIYGKGIDRVNLKEEIGDLLWYIALACQAYNLDLEEIQVLNIAKLMKRYPEKFTNELAINRNLEEERKILENEASRP